MVNMDQLLVKEISNTLYVKETQVQSVLSLLDEGNTIPFIARYRKEVTGGLDEEQINEIHKSWEYGINLFKRKEDVIRLIEEKGMMNDALRAQILSSNKLVEVEDLYRPYKEKKKTKATEAIALGLEPLANMIMALPNQINIEKEAEAFLTDQVLTVADALQGAKYIISEQISDNADYRKALRVEMEVDGLITSKAKKNAEALDEKHTYEMYYEHVEKVSKIAPHRVLAMNRAEDEKIITISIDSNIDAMLKYLGSKILTNSNSPVSYLVKEAIEDALKRLIYPSLEREIRSDLTSKAEDQAIEVFAMNLRNLLLQRPMKDKVVLGVDPAYRTGCKLCVVNEQGTVLQKGVIYPHEKFKGEKEAIERLPLSEKIVKQFIAKYQVSIIAIGNGTASRETEAFIADLLKKNNLDTKYVIVSEAGASVYSASEIAREEFPDYSVEERSAASIARRLQDPLSELVKIDPKSIGVGQYQHDVSQKKLTESLDFIVSNAVNQVGVNINTASKSLLTFVSGLNKTVSENIVKYRDQNGAFKNRAQIKKVPRLGDKAFEQSVGFLRIVGGDEALDMTQVHPESYEPAKKIMSMYHITPELFGKPELKSIVEKIDRAKLQQELGIDKYTLADILDAFIAPLRDPRDQFDAPVLRNDILHLEDLKPGMMLEGTVRNVVDFGAFVDCGLKEDGLVHISKLSKGFVKHPKDVVAVGDIVKVWVLSVDEKRGKVSLSMIEPR
ncbi:MAG: RNA-binding transcriptional accessory protein [Clostridia bacterium]|nr:RNA-binding transcriptional accessory protein [Clostridia bacterium]